MTSLSDVAEENSDIVLESYVEQPLVLPYQLGPDDQRHVVIRTMGLQVLVSSLRNLFPKQAGLGAVRPVRGPSDMNVHGKRYLMDNL
ncbi:hypothetical protein EYF80_043381 [Liparis tanakae]|uniref:Uncharacterized protein n=1 Tax=Liparis tanakae TaxID=230148 RepID=A0A4Z2FZZ1_9TELE|nr:hypothetical protein EYF80_043381 [Liparis tanakae]